MGYVPLIYNQVHAMDIQLVADKQVVTLAANGHKKATTVYKL
jgi:hypothetical protein